ncbi:tRNA-uridine aminocarboxypropyltransferase [Micromonospora robiginosa]|uniref:tRNA-uridine aminocarboxypropyltransferase n=1 Tax=Micromonospora robiginosa TaxID=2749844 RepID=A0A7L6B3H5_9ACTN|nr:tRNA-uridine aminocarboxypropyltransferase [Micromonospora ferruginea]QLQ36476.1 tRNA-uridine aminocarboxypropyltransferase [Micromonospora ferruginea]
MGDPRPDGEGRRRRCAGCGRPPAACWCRFVTPVHTPHRLVVLRHPREARHALGTVRVLARVIPETEVFDGVRRSPAADHAVRGDAARPPLLLYPVSATTAAPAITGVPGGGPYTIVVLDGTWRQARSMLKADDHLGTMPRMSISPTTPSRYAVRAQPFPHGLSTLEAVAEALVVLGAEPAVREALLRPFRALVGMHLACGDAGGADVLDDPAALLRAGYLPPPPPRQGPGQSPHTGL